ncbi:hypothetical protein [Streptomyces avicenniae]|uniref:hypothetical protein n=1 Tax=Streptomyces avicenniae TaxID=500153 RepID=UPI00069A790D|nr:hypothetical protein [Streptomyces avicenniae]
MSAIVALWARAELPIKDGLHLASGMSVAVELAPGTTSGVRFLEPFDPEAELRADPEWVTSIDITRTLPLDGGARVLCCGDGAYGSEGFVASTRGDGALEWVMYLQDSDPFVEITSDGRHATFLSTSGVRVTLDAASPWSPMP